MGDAFDVGGYVALAAGRPCGDIAVTWLGVSTNGEEGRWSAKVNPTRWGVASSVS
jgi:hypothetical protein